MNLQGHQSHLSSQPAYSWECLCPPCGVPSLQTEALPGEGKGEPESRSCGINNEWGSSGTHRAASRERQEDLLSPSWPALGRGCQPNFGLGYMSSGALNIGAFPTEEKTKQKKAGEWPK